MSRPLRRIVGFCRRLALVSSGAGFCLLHASAQMQSMQVSLVDSHVDPNKPLPHVRIELSYASGSALTSQGVHVTNDQGQLLLPVDEKAIQVGKIQLSINRDDTQGLVLYEPASGLLDSLPPSLQLKMLPAGNRALLSPAQIEALLYTYSQRNIQLQTQNRQLNRKLEADARQKDDLAEAQKRWAEALGFDYNTVKDHIQDWAATVLADKTKATREQLKLAALANGDIDEYVRLCETGRSEAEHNLQTRDASVMNLALEGVRNDLRHLLDESQSEAKGFYLKVEDHEATELLKRTAQQAQEQHETYPKDAAIRQLWLSAALSAAVLKEQEGKIAHGPTINSLLAEAVADYRVILAALNQGPDDQDQWARAQNDLGNVLLSEALRANSANSASLFSQAVTAFKAALQVRTRDHNPVEWAETQNDLGNTLQNQGERADGASAADLIGQAVVCYNNALKVRSKDQTPAEWALAWNDLGIALRKLGERVAGPDAKKHLHEVVDAHQHSLEVRNQSKYPREWGRTHFDLGVALTDQGKIADGAESRTLLANAVSSFQDSLTYSDSVRLPQAWADRQLNLGNAYATQGERTTGTDSNTALAAAVAAYNHALEVNTPAELPQEWAQTQVGLGNAYRLQARNAAGGEADAVIASAVAADRSALTVLTETGLPQDWAAAQTQLCLALTAQSTRATDPAGTLKDAQSACESSLRVYTRAALPQQWARNQTSLGVVYAALAERASASDRTALSKQAAQCFQQALDVDTAQDFPYDHASILAGMNKLYIRGTI